jgi:RNA polymerase sigma-70 factor (ECF subfamily)
MRDDLEAIARVLTGEVEAFRPLVERYQGPLLALVRNLLPRGSDVEALAQETFLAAFRHLRSFDPARSAFSTWLFAIARNKCLNERKRPRPAGSAPEPAHVRTPEAEAAGAELAQRLDECLAELPFEQRSAFVLAELHGLSLQEVGRIEGVAVGTVKSRLSRARARLRALLAGLGLEVP